MPPKSFKADGTPKQRWSSADRSARGHAPRRRGGQPRGRAADTTGPAGYRDAKSAPRAAKSGTDERPAKVRHTRPDRAEWPGREARTHSNRSYSRTTTDDRPRNDKFVRADKPARTEKSTWSDKPNRSERSYRSGSTRAGPRGPRWQVHLDRTRHPGRPGRQAHLEQPPGPG